MIYNNVYQFIKTINPFKGTIMKNLYKQTSGNVSLVMSNVLLYVMQTRGMVIQGSPIAGTFTGESGERLSIECDLNGAEDLAFMITGNRLFSIRKDIVRSSFIKTTYRVTITVK